MLCPCVTIATRYGLDGLGIESQWGRDFPQPSRWVPRSTWSLIQWIRVSSSAGFGTNHISPIYRWSCEWVVVLHKVFSAAPKWPATRGYISVMATFQFTCSSIKGITFCCLRAGRSGIDSRWGRDFPSVQTGPWAHPMGTGSFPGVKCGRSVLLTTHPLLVPRS